MTPQRSAFAPRYTPLSRYIDMTPNSTRKIRLGPLLLAALALLAGCANNPAIQEARDHIDAGRSESGLQVLQKATKDNPQNLAYRSEHFRQR